MKFKIRCKKEVFQTYGKVRIIKTKPLGIVLDAIIPCTFGLITLGLTKYYGDEIRI